MNLFLRFLGLSLVVLSIALMGVSFSILRFIPSQTIGMKAFLLLSLCIGVMHAFYGWRIFFLERQFLPAAKLLCLLTMSILLASGTGINDRLFTGLSLPLVLLYGVFSVIVMKAEKAK